MRSSTGSKIGEVHHYYLAQDNLSIYLTYFVNYPYCASVNQMTAIADYSSMSWLHLSVVRQSLSTK